MIIHDLVDRLALELFPGESHRLDYAFDDAQPLVYQSQNVVQLSRLVEHGVVMATHADYSRRYPHCCAYPVQGSTT
jgi:hypothetical protein